MTTDPKAPLPEEAIDVFFNDSSGNKKRAFYNRHGISASDYLRAHIAAQEEKIAKLEADNKRLREAADIALGHMTGGLDGNWADCDPIEKLRAALAQTAEPEVEVEQTQIR